MDMTSATALAAKILHVIADHAGTYVHELEAADPLVDTAITMADTYIKNHEPAAGPAHWVAEEVLDLTKHTATAQAQANPVPDTAPPPPVNPAPTPVMHEDLSHHAGDTTIHNSETPTP